MMWPGFLVLLVLFSAESLRAEVPALPIKLRELSSFSRNSEWELTGTPLLFQANGRRGGYVPLRRERPSPCGDEGKIQKRLFGDAFGTERIIWESSVGASRRVLIVPCGDDGPSAGELRPLGGYDPAAGGYFGVDETLWAEWRARLRETALGAPFPAAMVDAENSLYVQTDDGLICAFDAATGKERWAFAPPQLCWRTRAESLVRAKSLTELPWLAAGGLTAERVNVSSRERILLWGTLGLGARALFCLDVTDPLAPSFLWGREDLANGACLRWGGVGDKEERALLGHAAAAPLAIPLAGKWSLLVPSGTGARGRLLSYDALSGELTGQSEGGDAELCLPPLGLNGSSASLQRVALCDSRGGVQIFLRQAEDFRFSERIDLEKITLFDELNFRFAPIPCVVSRGLWLAFVGENGAGTLVAAAPAALKNLRWSAAPWRGSGWGWWLELKGFHDVVSALFYDGLLYLLGQEEQRRVLQVVDLTPGRLAAAETLSDKAAGLAIRDGKVVVLENGADGPTAVPVLSALPAPSSGIYYTLYR